MTSQLHVIVDNSPRLMPRTKTMYRAALDRWIEFAGPDPSGWTRERTGAFYRELIGSGMKVKSANAVLSGVQYAAKWWSREQARSELDFGMIERGKPERTVKRDALTAEESLAMLDTTVANTPIDLRDRALLVTALETGMRAMSLQSIELERVITRDYPFVAVKLKGQAELYEVPLSDTALAGMRPWRDWLAGEKITKGAMFRRLAAGIDRRGRRQYEAGPDALSTVAIWQIVTSRAAKAKLRHVHPHIFRHTFITHRMKILSPFQIAAVTGHSLPEFGELPTYVDQHELGGQARLYTPSWLSEWCARICR